MPETTLSETIGLRAKELRIKSGATLDDVAQAARQFGVSWTTGKISHIEHGKVSLTLDDFFILGQALMAVTVVEVSPSALIRSTDPIRIAPNWLADPSLIVGWLQGLPLQARPVIQSPQEPQSGSQDGKQKSALRDIRKWRKRMFDIAFTGPASHGLSKGELMKNLRVADSHQTLAETRAADTLNIGTTTLAAHSISLWGHRLNTERNKRLEAWASETGKTPNAQKKGQITRSLLNELRESIRAHEEDS